MDQIPPQSVWLYFLSVCSSGDQSGGQSQTRLILRVFLPAWEDEQIWFCVGICSKSRKMNLDVRIP